MNKSFSIEESLWFGWQKTKEHSRLLFQVLLTFIGIDIVRAILDAIVHASVPAVGIVNAAASVTEVILGIGITVITLKIARGEPTSYSDIVPNRSVAIRYILASAVVGIIVMVTLGIPAAIGIFVALMIPSLIWSRVVGALFIALGVALAFWVAMRYFVVKYAAIEEIPRSTLEVLRQSTVLTVGVRWKLMLFLLALILLNIIGAILLIVGLLITVPVTLIATAHVYTKLFDRLVTHA